MTNDCSKKPLSPLLPPSPGGHGRRQFVRQLALGAVTIGSLPIAACGSKETAPALRFAHGVASGDPLADRIILWTRVSPPAGHKDRISVDWEVASDADFKHIISHGTTETHTDRDFTVKVDATGLQPASRYFYRFRAAGQLSSSGRTKTLPTGDIDQVKLAVFSCSNYPAGYFNAYADAARHNELDACIHLGDYIYEYGQGGYATGNAAALGRMVEPLDEIVSLSDYRTRYAQYRCDGDLQALHAAAPMIAVWDDHEISNNTWTDGASNHQGGSKGRFYERKAAAIQAYHEWMPTRNVQPDLIYRSFDFGNLLSLHMLDTRVVARNQQINYRDFFGTNGLDLESLQSTIDAPERQLLGITQTRWLEQQMSASKATWQVLGQQVLMGRMQVPVPILMEMMVMEMMDPSLVMFIADYAALYAQAKMDPASLSEQQKIELDLEKYVPYNSDAWDGYPAAREAVLNMARQGQKNLVVLAGDTHNAWASELHAKDGTPVGVEFATSSVTSPGLERYLSHEVPSKLATALQQVIEPLKYCETERRGYMIVTATRSECRAEWIYVNTITSRQFGVRTDKSLSVKAGAPGVLV